MNKILPISGTALVFSILLPFVLYHSIRFIYWLDGLFYVGLALLVISGVMKIIEGQFFSAFIQSTKHFFKTISKKEQLIREIEGKKEERTLSARKSFPTANIYGITGICFCLFSLLGSILFVYLGR